MKRIIVMLMALVAIAAGVKAQAIPDGVYWIKFAGKPEFMLTVFSERTSFSNAGMKNVVKLGKEKNDVSQQWKVTNNADGTIEIRSMKDADYAICPPDAKNLKDREQIYAGKKAAGTCGLWVPERLGNGSFVLLVAQNRNFCLNLRNGNQAVSEKVSWMSIAPIKDMKSNGHLRILTERHYLLRLLLQLLLRRRLLQLLLRRHRLFNLLPTATTISAQPTTGQSLRRWCKASPRPMLS